MFKPARVSSFSRDVVRQTFALLGDGCGKNDRVAYYLGIDGGGSKTACVVGDESSVLASAQAGPCNITRVGEATARHSLHESILQACAAAKIAPAQLEKSCIGVAGAGRKEIAAVIHRMAAEVIPGEIEVVGDMRIAMQAAFGEGPGVIVVAGTGSIAYGHDAEGKTARAGGWGFAISDEGSAHWIGRAVVAALLRSYDEVSGDHALKSSALFGDVKTVWKVDSFEQIIATANSHADFALLLPAIVGAAEDGDTLATQVLAAAGSELAQLAAIVLRRLFPGSCEASFIIPLAVAGGVFRHAAPVRKTFCDQMRSMDANLRIDPGVIDPAQGALQMARQGSVCG